MSGLETLAYPTLMAAIYGAYRVGKRRSMDVAFERARVVVLAILVGVLILVQWRLVETGVVRSTLGYVLGTIGIACALALVAIHLMELHERDSERPARWLAR